MAFPEHETQTAQSRGSQSANPARARRHGSRASRSKKGAKDRQRASISFTQQTTRSHADSPSSTLNEALPTARHVVKTGQPPQPIRKAIEDVNKINASLRKILEQMQEVEELLEIAAIRKEVDEKEISTLREALSRLQR